MNNMSVQLTNSISFHAHEVAMDIYVTSSIAPIKHEQR